MAHVPVLVDANTPLDALDFAGEPAFGKPPSLPEPGLEWGTW